MKIKNVYTGTELTKCLKWVTTKKQPTKIIFHEDLFGFCDDIIEIEIVYKTGEYCVTTLMDNKTRSFSNEWNFKDYIYAICGW